MTRAILTVRFYPSWWMDNYGFVFGERYAMDVQYRVQLDMQKQRLIHARFADIGLGTADPQPEPALGQVYKDVVAVIFGSTVGYEGEDVWMRCAHVPPERIRQLSVPNVEDDPHIKELVRQGRWFTARYGPALLTPGSTGLLNSATKIVGEEFFEQILTEPEAAHHLMSVLRQTTIEIHRYFHTLCGQPAPIGVGNCTVSMISPRLYEEFLMPYDLVLMRYAQSRGLPFGFHMDGKMDKHAPVIARFPHLQSVDMGSDTTIGLVRQIMPGPYFRIYLYPAMLMGYPLSDVHELLRRLVSESGAEKTYIQFDVCRGMSDDLIRTVTRAVREFEA
jgi:hypothetical protein